MQWVDNRQSFKLCTLRPLWSNHLPLLESSGVKRACRGLKPFGNSGQKPLLIRELKQTWGSDSLSASSRQHQLLASHSISSFRVATRNGNSYIQHKAMPRELHTQHCCEPPLAEFWLKDWMCLTRALHLPCFTWLCFLKAPRLPLCHMNNISRDLQRHNVKGDRNTNSQHRLGFKCFLTHSGYRCSTDFNTILAQ